jgi:ABC-type uncharacterized transport system involved in gliding motility auxiliary subunit
MAHQVIEQSGPTQHNLDTYDEWAGEQPLVAMLSGKFKFMYEGKNVPEWPEEEEEEAGEDKEKDKKKEEKKPEKAELKEPRESTVVVVGSSEFAKDVYMEYSDDLYQGNLIFLRNVVEALALPDSKLLTIRSKQPAQRPLDEDLSSTQRGFYKFFNVLGVPILVALAGIAYALIRHSTSSTYERRFAEEALAAMEGDSSSQKNQGGDKA